MQDIELVDGKGIFHNDDMCLKHELIDIDKATQMVTALRHLKEQFATELANADQPGLSSGQNLLDAVQVLDNGTLSVNMANYQ